MTDLEMFKECIKNDLYSEAMELLPLLERIVLSEDTKGKMTQVVTSAQSELGKDDVEMMSDIVEDIQKDGKPNDDELKYIQHVADKLINTKKLFGLIKTVSGIIIDSFISLNLFPVFNALFANLPISGSLKLYMSILMISSFFIIKGKVTDKIKDTIAKNSETKPTEEPATETPSTDTTTQEPVNESVIIEGLSKYVKENSKNFEDLIINLAGDRGENNLQGIHIDKYLRTLPKAQPFQDEFRTRLNGIYSKIKGVTDPAELTRILADALGI